MESKKPDPKPYECKFEGGPSNIYSFETIRGFIYQISFTPTPYLFGEDSIHSKNTYELSLSVIFNPTGENPPFDYRTALTLANAFGDFYDRSADTITLYICASYDNRQLIRAELFSRWFSHFHRDDYARFDQVIRDSTGERYPVCLIVKKKNPHRAELFEAFVNAIDGYNEGKPE